MPCDLMPRMLRGCQEAPGHGESKEHDMRGGRTQEVRLEAGITSVLLRHRAKAA